MKSAIIIGIIVIAIGAGAWLFFQNRLAESDFASRPQEVQRAETDMILESSAFENNGSIPARYTCDGENIIPPLRISGVPDTAVSLVLIMDDPDVPKNLRPDGNFDHWLIWNIPAGTVEIAESRPPAGVEGNNSAGRSGYTGPCPPDREHRYFFKLFALDAELDLNPETATKVNLEAAMEGHVLSQTELMGRYDRK